MHVFCTSGPGCETPSFFYLSRGPRVAAQHHPAGRHPAMRAQRAVERGSLQLSSGLGAVRMQRSMAGWAMRISRWWLDQTWFAHPLVHAQLPAFLHYVLACFVPSAKQSMHAAARIQQPKCNCTLACFMPSEKRLELSRNSGLL